MGGDGSVVRRNSYTDSSGRRINRDNRFHREISVIGDDFSAIYRFEAFFDRWIFGCGRVDRICSELSCGLVDNIGIGIECGIECNCAMDGDIAYKYASGIGNGSFVHQ